MTHSNYLNQAAACSHNTSSNLGQKNESKTSSVGEKSQKANLRLSWNSVPGLPSKTPHQVEAEDLTPELTEESLDLSVRWCTLVKQTGVLACIFSSLEVGLLHTLHMPDYMDPWARETQVPASIVWTLVVEWLSRIHTSQSQEHSYYMESV